MSSVLSKLACESGLVVFIKYIQIWCYSVSGDKAGIGDIGLCKAPMLPMTP